MTAPGLRTRPSMLTPDQIKELSNRINDLLPDDPRMAVTVLALNYACIACCTGLDDEAAIEAVRRALRQMRKHWSAPPDHPSQDQGGG